MKKEQGVAGKQTCDWENHGRSLDYRYQNEKASVTFVLMIGAAHEKISFVGFHFEAKLNSDPSYKERSPGPVASNASQKLGSWERLKSH